MLHRNHSAHLTLPFPCAREGRVGASRIPQRRTPAKPGFSPAGSWGMGAGGTGRAPALHKTLGRRQCSGCRASHRRYRHVRTEAEISASKPSLRGASWGRSNPEFTLGPWIALRRRAPLAMTFEALIFARRVSTAREMADPTCWAPLNHLWRPRGLLGTAGGCWRWRTTSELAAVTGRLG